MGRRAGHSNVGFESDSFLDVIANIVGILIILIVIAGVRVSHAPVRAPSGPTEPQTESDATRVVESPESSSAADALADVAISGSDSSEPEPIARSQNDYVLEPFAELVQQIERLQHDLSAQESEIERQRALASQWSSQAAELDREVQAASQRLAAASGQFDSDRQRLLDLDRGVQDKQQTLQRLAGQIDEAQRSAPQAKTLRHRLTPVSREVTGDELHFRLSENRVAYVPVKELVERLRPQIERQKEWLVKYRRHQGRIGPVDGFVMDYIVEREALSTLDTLRNGQGVMQIQVSEWQIDPEPDMKSETFAEALRRDSAFVRALRTAGVEATLTFWVYPDSFDLYRKLQEVAQREGFTVAGRPLPHGVPIAGSPRGSRSAGQ